MFLQPRTIPEALHAKKKHLENAAFIAGGTDIVVLMNQGKARPAHMIDLSHVDELKSVRRANGFFELGANVTYSQCASLPLQCLAMASRGIGGPGIRNLGTLAGNLASASPAADGATALLALDARLELQNSSGSKIVEIADFFQGYRKTVLAADEMISRILVPAEYRSGWLKIGKRGAMNISIASAAVAITSGNEVRIALASMSPTPMRCFQAEDFLHRRGLDTASIDEAIGLVQSEVRPISDHRASSEYKIHLAGVLVGRLLKGLICS